MIKAQKAFFREGGGLFFCHYVTDVTYVECNFFIPICNMIYAGKCIFLNSKCI